MNKMQWIIQNTVKYYSEDISRRSLGKIGCLYKGPDNKECAFQRAVIDDLSEYDKIMEETGFSATPRKLCKIVTFKTEFNLTEKDLKKEKIPKFWQDIQNLHDDSFLWCENGLTIEGKEEVKRLMEKYKS